MRRSKGPDSRHMDAVLIAAPDSCRSDHSLSVCCSRLHSPRPPGARQGTQGLDTGSFLQAGFLSVSRTSSLSPQERSGGVGQYYRDTDTRAFYCVFFRLVRVEISFALKGIDLQAIHSREVPDCYSFQNTASVFVAQQPLSVLFPMAFVEEDEHLSVQTLEAAMPEQL